MKRSLLSRLVPGLLALAPLASCTDAAPQCTSSSDCSSGMRCVSGRCASGDGSAGEAARDVLAPPTDGENNGEGGVMDSGNGDASRPCFEGNPCPGGVCAGGSCCPSANVCGAACCGAGSVCFAGACVVPGPACRTSADCTSGSYCEAALGAQPSADGGVDGALADGAREAATGDAARADGGATRVCTAPTPVAGRCLTLPPVCPSAGDGGVSDASSADAGACVGHCEYRPPRGGMLQTEVAWSWGQPTPPPQYPEYIDVWSTPAVGRIYDANCDGRTDSLDPPNMVFVSGRSIHATTGLGTCCQCTTTTPTACHTGVLRVLDGRTGADLLALRSASATSAGFAGVSVALGDIDNDHDMDIVAVTGEGFIVAIDGSGAVLRTSDMALPGAAGQAFGWGGGLALADMDGDGNVEVAYGNTVYTTAGGGLTRRFQGAAGGGGGGADQYLSTLADVDGAADRHLELVAGKTVYRADGTVLWNRADLPDGFPAVADLNGDGRPEVVLVASGRVWVLNGLDGTTLLGPTMLPGMGTGGPPTVADFNGDGHPDIGVATANYYAVLRPSFMPNALTELWRTPNHDLSSSVTGSTVFDFEGDGAAEVVYADECFLWVFDGTTGRVRYAGLTTSFTGTEASIVADVDGDGHAELVSISNGADPSPAGWGCNTAPWNTADAMTGRPAWQPPAGAPAYRGVRVLRDPARSWVGTRPLWNQHTYHVSNICEPTDDACPAGSWEGQLPRVERASWTLPWLNSFRQNVQQSALFSAPDATVSLEVQCADPPVLVASVRNLGEALLPAGVSVGFYLRAGGTDMLLGRGTTTAEVFPGSVARVSFTAPAGTDAHGTFVAKVLVDPMHPTFRECRATNNDSAPASAPCPG